MRIVQIGPYTYIDCNIWLIDQERPFIVDAGTGQRVEDAIAELELELAGRRPEGLILTHQHSDHTGGALQIAEHFGCPIYAGVRDAEQISSAEPDRTLCWQLGVDLKPMPCTAVADGFVFDTGECELTVIETPGHTPGSICLFDKESKILISGDTVFANGYGRTDFPGGSLPEMINSLLRIDGFGISSLYPGHGPYTKGGAMSVKRALIMVGR